MDAAADHALMVKQAPSKAKPVKVARPMNSFMVFAKEHRKLLQAENPDSDNKIISRMLGEKWAALGAQGKQRYIDQATELKKQHSIEHPDWKFTRDTSRKRSRREGREPTVFKEPKITNGGDCRESLPVYFNAADLRSNLKAGVYINNLRPPSESCSGTKSHLEKQFGHLEELKFRLEQQQAYVQYAASAQCLPPNYVSPPPIKQDLTLEQDFVLPTYLKQESDFK